MKGACPVRWYQTMTQAALYNHYSKVATLKKIGQGGSAEVFDLGNGEILKLFFLHREDYCQQEMENYRLIEKTNLPIMHLDRSVKIAGRSGLVFSGALVGATIGQIIKKTPWRTIELARLLADLHVRIHEQEAPHLPSFHSRLKTRIEKERRLTQLIRSNLLAAADKLPRGDRLCHGDFHIDNVIIGDGRCLIIDWNSCSRGAVACDVYKTLACLLYENRELPFFYRKAQRPLRRLLAREYLSYYSKKAGIHLAPKGKVFNLIDIGFRLRKGPKTHEHALRELSMRGGFNSGESPTGNIAHWP